MFSSREMMIELQRSVIKFAQQQSVNNLQHTISIFCFILQPAVSVDFQVLFSQKAKHTADWLVLVLWNEKWWAESHHRKPRRRNQFETSAPPPHFHLTTANSFCAVPSPYHRSTRTTALYLRGSCLLNSVITAEWGSTPRWLSIHGWLESIALEIWIVLIYLFLNHKMSWVLHWLLQNRVQDFFWNLLLHESALTVDRGFKSCTCRLPDNLDNSETGTAQMKATP